MICKTIRSVYDKSESRIVSLSSKSSLRNDHQ